MDLIVDEASDDGCIKQSPGFGLTSVSLLFFQEQAEVLYGDVKLLWLSYILDQVNINGLQHDALMESIQPVSDENVELQPPLVRLSVSLRKSSSLSEQRRIRVTHLVVEIHLRGSNAPQSTRSFIWAVIKQSGQSYTEVNLRRL